MAELTGRTISRYRILEKLGSGGMGDVYLATDTELHRNVALKVLAPEVRNDPQRMHRFELEARAASALNHPNVAHIYEIGAADDVRFIAMEHVEGISLEPLAKPGSQAIFLSYSDQPDC